MEEKGIYTKSELLQPLVEYTFGIGEELKCALFDNLFKGTEEEKTKKIADVWNLFFKILDTSNLENCKFANLYIRKEMCKYCKNIDGHLTFMFDEDVDIKSKILETFFHCLLNYIDPVYYDDKRFNNGKYMVVACINELKKRSFSKSRVKDATIFLYEPKDKRNKASHAGTEDHPAEMMESYLKAFFVATVIGSKIYDVGAAIYIKANLKKPSNMNSFEKKIYYKTTITLIGFVGRTQFYTKILKKSGDTDYIPVSKKLFANDSKVIVRLNASALQYESSSIEIEVRRGDMAVELFKEEVIPSAKAIKNIWLTKTSTTSPQEPAPESVITPPPIFDPEAESLLPQESNNDSGNFLEQELEAETENVVSSDSEISKIYLGTTEASFDKSPQRVSPVQIIYDGRLLTMSCSTRHANIYYTLDGTLPNERTARYLSPFRIGQSKTVKAIAVMKDYEDSEISTFMVPQGDSIVEQVRKHWLWVVAMAIVIAVVLLFAKNLDSLWSSVPEPKEQTAGLPSADLYPMLDGKGWIVKKMDGQEVAVGQVNAEIHTSASSENQTSTECRMVVVGDYESQFRQITFDYDRYTGQLSSPQLGVGKIEIVNGMIRLKISFEGWIIEK